MVQAVSISTSVQMEVMLVMFLRPVLILTEATIATVGQDSKITKIRMEMEKCIVGILRTPGIVPRRIGEIKDM